MQVNAGIWAKALKVVTGANQVDADGGQSTPVASTGVAPSFALDVAALGGMYANHIFLVGSEAGLGARNAGTLQTTGGVVSADMGLGEFTITSAGRLENTGTIQTAGDANVSAQSFANAGAVRSGGGLTIATQGDLANNNAGVGGTLEAQRVALSSAAGDLSNRQGTIRQTSAAALSINAPSLSNTNAGFIGAEPVTSSTSSGTTTASGSTGTTTGSSTGGTTSAGTTSGSASGTGTSTPTTTTAVVAPGAITASGTIFNDGGVIYAGGPIALNTPNVNNAGGNLHVATMAVRGPTFSNAGGTLNVANTFHANVGIFNNAGGQLHAGGIAITTLGDLSNQAGSLLSDSDTTLSVGGDADNRAGTVSAVGALAAQVAGTVNNTSGTLIANQAVNIASASLNNTQGSVQSVGGATQLSVAGDLLNDRGRIGAGTDLSVRAGTLENLGSGSLRAGNDATITVANSLTHEGSLTAGRNTTITAGSLNGSATGVLGAGIQTDGTLASAGELSVTTTNGLVAKGSNLAAGDASFQGASVDIGGSKTSGANLALMATSGDVTTSNATVTTPGTLTVTADAQPTQTLVNDAGTLSANQLELHASNIQNTSAGQIVQTGTGATTLAVAGTINTMQGTIASNGQDLTLGASTLLNTGGTLQHAGNGTLAISATTFSGANGTIVSNGGLVVHAGSFHQDGGTTSAKQVSIDATTLSNVGGSIVQTGSGDTRIAVVDSLTNDGGTIASNGATFSIEADRLSSANGHIQHAGTGTLALNAGAYNGASGEIVSNGAFTGHVTGSFNQDGGTTSARQITLGAASISNVGGMVIQTGTGTTHVATTGDLVNDGGTIASNGSDVSVSAGSTLSNVHGHLQHAGTGTLGLSAASYAGAGGEIVSNGGLVANVAGAFNQDGGTTSAKQLTLDAASLSNVGGTLIQTGTGATHIAATDTLNNTAGRIASNGSNVAIAATDVLNTDGAVQHAGTGTLDLQATQSFSGARGQIVSNGALHAHGGSFNLDGGATSAAQIGIDVASLSNKTGQIVQTGTGPTYIATTGNLVNDGGTLASNGSDLSVTAGGTLSNARGHLQHAGTGTFNLAAGSYDGAAGELVTNGGLVANVAGGFNQDGGKTSAKQITLDAGSLSNVGGTVTQIGAGATHIAAVRNLVNDGGTIASNGSDLSVSAGGALSNAHGYLQHAGTGTVGLTAASYAGTGGEILSNGALVVNVTGSFAQDGGTTSADRIDISSDSLSNRGGQIIQRGTGATLQAQVANALDNTNGLIGTVTGSGGAIDVKFQSIANQGGRISSDGDLMVQSTGDLRNEAGVLRAGGNLAASASGSLTNAQGAIEAAGSTSTLSVQAAQIDNTEGRVANAGTGDTTLTAGTLTNSTSVTGGSRGLIAGNGALIVNASTLNNLANATLTSGGPLTLAVSDTVTNRGTIASNRALTFNQANATLDNTAGGQITAAGDLRIAINTLRNDAGRIATTDGSGGDLFISANTLSNRGGTLASDRDLQLTLPGSYVNDSLLHAGRDLKLSIGGDLTNTSTGTLEAVRTLRADVGGQMTNAPGGVVQAQNVDLHVAGGLNNTGEITGTTVNVAADSISNTGNGAITGDDVTLSSRTLTNQGPQALIAATSKLALWTVDSLANTDGATLYSLGNLQIAANAARDASGHLANATNTIVNSASTIEAGGNMEIAVNALVNDRPGVSIQQVQTLDETYHMAMPSWWRNADGNNFAYNPNATNYFPYDVYYVNPADILENTTMVTPDGHIIGRAVIRTHANDTAFFTARAGRSSLYGHRERIIQSDDTMVLYYLGSTVNAPNPDQVPGVTSGVWQYEQAVQYWDAAPPAFNSAYGTCSTNCVRFFTQPDYTDPNIIMQRDTQLSLPGVASEVGREAHTIAVDDQLASGAGALGRIVAGGNIYIGFTGSVANNYSDIMAGGQLAIIGPSPGTGFTNTATTLYRRYKFDGLRLYSNGSTLAYTMPSLSLPIGSVSGVVSGGQGVTISAGSIRNVDTSAGSAANIVSQVQLTSGGTPNSGAGAGTASGSGQSSAGGTTVGAAQGSTASTASGTGAVAANGSTAGRASGTSGAGSAGGTIAVSLVNPGAGGGAGTGIGTLPHSGLFTLAPHPSSRYLYETRPAFANYRNWLSSDYLLTNLGLDPNTTQKRLGDGFYEQQLIDQQVAQLTGRRFLSGYADDDTQYAALMTAGVTFAEQYGLRPGVALTADQMARLTSDIVWLESQTVTLPDGRTQNVLVPKVYLAQVGPNALKPGGALITGDDIRIEAGSIVNRGGSIGDSNTHRAVLVASADIVNQGGVIQADVVGLKAGGDILNQTLAKTQGYGQSDAQVTATGSITSVSNVARIVAKDNLFIDAGRDVVDTAGRIGSGGTAFISGGRDVKFESLATGSSYQASVGASSMSREARQANVGQVTVGKDLQMVAGRDMTFEGTQVTADGNALLSAGRHMTIDAATSGQSSDQRSDPAGTQYRQTRSETTVQGASVSAGGNLIAYAGTKEAGDVKVVGSQLDAKGATYLSASRDVVIGAALETRASDDYTHSTSSNAFAKRSSTERDAVSSATVVGSSVSGNTVTMVAGNDLITQASDLRSDGAMRLSASRDIKIGTAEQTVTESHFKEQSKSATGLGKLTGIALGADTVGAKLISSNAAMDANAVTRTDAVGSTISAGSLQTVSGRDTTLQGSTVVADNDVTMFAGRNLTVESAQNTLSGNSQSASSKSGMIGSWSQPSFGNVKQEEANQGSSTIQSSSQIASLQGDVTLVAGGTYRQTASSVMALGQAGPLVGGDVNVVAKSVVINEAFDTGTSSTQTRSASTVLGGSASIGGISTDSLRGASNTVNAMGNTSDSRMQALGAANLAMQGKQAYDTAATVVAGGGVGYKVSVNVSRNKSESQSSTQASQAVGSSIVGANNVNIIATGGGAESNIHAVDSTIAAGDTVNLMADNQIDLQASKSTYAQQGTNSSSGASIGIGFAAGSQNGFTLELGASRGKGHANGSDVTYTNTHVSGGRAVNVQSGGDLTMKGAVIDAPKVTADVGGNLNVESLQDTSTQVSKQSSSGLNASLCIPPFCYGVSTVGGSAASAKANGDFASVTEQSGIKAGDGGFDVNVKGHTDLKGGVISSTQAAIDGKKNSFQTASLATSDIENHSTYKASGYAVSGSVSGGLGDQSTATSDADKAAAKNAATSSRPGGGAGVGSASGSQTSTTKAGISGVAGDATVRSDDTAASTGALVKNWDTTSLLKDVQGQAQLTQEFGQRAAYQVGTYADKKYNELKNSDPAEAAKWAEGGEYRVAAHAATGLLAGGVGGALGAGASAALMPRIGEAIADMGLPAPVAQAVGAATAAAIGAAAGGGAGAASAYNIDVNNRQLHPTERGVLRAEAKRVAREQIPGFEQLSPEQQASAESYWYNQLSAAALARVDDKGQATRDAYLAGVAGTNQPGLQGSLSSAQVLANADVASNVVDRLASQSSPILNMYGEPVQSGGQPLTAFNATAEQRANSYLLNTPTAEAERQQIANQNRATLNYLGAVNGGAQRDYTVEEFLLGGAIGGRAVEAIAGVLERGATVTAARSPSRTGAYDGANGGTAVTGELTGTRTAISAADDAATIRSLTRENESATTLANNGYKVQQNPATLPNGKNPDYIVNGQVFDNYAPSTGNVRNAADRIGDKVMKEQANNVVVNLADSSITPSALKEQLTNYPIPGLKQVIIIDKTGTPTVIKFEGK